MFHTDAERREKRSRKRRKEKRKEGRRLESKKRDRRKDRREKQYDQWKREKFERGVKGGRGKRKICPLFFFISQRSKED